MTIGSNPLDRVSWLYHFTDSRNIASIRRLGGLYSREQLTKISGSSYYPGGNKWSLDADDMFGLDKYVHLCFRPNHPMEHKARVVDKRIENTTWLYIDSKPLFTMDGVLFSYGVSNKSGAKIVPVNDAASDIDYEVLYTRTDWNDSEIRARLHLAELNEVLVPNHVPIKLFERYLANG